MPNDNLIIEYASPFESRLVFKEVTVAYAGTYYCKANNTLMKNIQSVDVRVKSEHNNALLSIGCKTKHSMCSPIYV